MRHLHISEVMLVINDDRTGDLVSSVPPYSASGDWVPLAKSWVRLFSPHRIDDERFCEDNFRLGKPEETKPVHHLHWFGGVLTGCEAIERLHKLGFEPASPLAAGLFLQVHGDLQLNWPLLGGGRYQDLVPNFYHDAGNRIASVHDLRHCLQGSAWIVSEL